MTTYYAAAEHVWDARLVPLMCRLFDHAWGTYAGGRWLPAPWRADRLSLRRLSCRRCGERYL